MSHRTNLRTSGKAVAAAGLAAVAALALTACGSDKSDDSGAKAPASSVQEDTSKGSGADGSGTDGSGTDGSGTDGSGSDGSDGSGADGSGTGKDGTASASDGSGTSAASGTNGSDRCTADAMSVRLGRGDVGAGNIHYSLVFTNNGSKSCVLRGYPGVSLLARDGQSIGQPATRAGETGSAVTLPPGGSGHAVLHTVNEGVTDKPCWKNAALVRTYPPGSKEDMTARTAEPGLRVCGEEFDVTAVAAGTGE